ncbi:MAG TPA: sugar transferase [Flavobacteriia bacterium]|jgi:lipopolysaccharide/colanic/teichoic acid biosynthesis glycosyltransferase|nr:sugar transferase [Flavobacteriia bacterium]
MLSIKQQLAKRLFDIVVALIGITVFLLPIVCLIFMATVVMGEFGLFSQQRVGQHAKLFTMYKIKTMKSNTLDDANIIVDDSRIPWFGKLLRRTKLDELPQLFNVLIGNMSLVGPRPDIVGYADKLTGEDKIILSVKPGITGPATLKFRNEEDILKQQPNPKKYNDAVIWKEKVKINKDYIQNWSFLGDIKYIFKTFFP